MEVTKELYDTLASHYDQLSEKFEALVKDLTEAETLNLELQNKLHQLNTLCKLSEVNQGHLDAMAKSKTTTERKLKEALDHIRQMSQEQNKAKQQTKREKRTAKRKADKAPVVNLNQFKALKQSLEEHQHALNYAAVRVGCFENAKGVTYDVYDNKVRTIITPKGEAKAHQLFLINQYGAGRMIYQNVDDGTIHVCAIPPQARWHLCKELENYCEGYFAKFHNNQGTKNG